jgi:lambda family phage portal protein
MIGRLLNQVIGVVAPETGLRRELMRQQLQRVVNSTGHKAMDALNGQTGYEAARRSRLNRSKMSGAATENKIPRGQIQQLRNDSWDLYRNNPHARKIIRQLEAKVIGRGLMPQPLAVDKAGVPLKEFRQRAREIWGRVSTQIDYRGKPGRGGQCMVDLQKTALRGTVLGGEIFYRFRRLSSSRQQRDQLLLPLHVQLIHADRLDETKNDDSTYYGIQINAKNQRVAYWVYDMHPADDRSLTSDSIRIWASEMGHLYVSDDIDQMRGTPWFSAALGKMRDIGDYEYNELQAAAVSSCVVMGYRRSAGQTQFGVDAPSDWDLTDADGNPITNITPGMLIDLGTDGEIQGFNPQRPNTSAPEFINHMLRSESAGVPGIKSSSLTGDYRNSSFSSERSADNDTWPEIEGLQDWMAESFCDPIYEAVIDTAVEEGLFEGIQGFSSSDYLKRREDYLAAEWRGPVPRSINPKDDAKCQPVANAIADIQSAARGSPAGP